MKEHLFRYSTPSLAFSDALPIGNGSIGAMVHGNFPEAKLSLNMDTLWSGGPVDKCARVPEVYRTQVRDLLWQGKIYEAEQIVQDHMVGVWNESYLSAAFLHLIFDGDFCGADATRFLDMQQECAGQTSLLRFQIVEDSI